MATRPRRQSPRGGAPTLLLPVVGFAVIGLLGLVLIASSLGWLERDEAANTIPEGSIAVPVAARPIGAYQAIQIEDLVDPATGQLAVIYLPADSVLAETHTDPKRLIGRVLGRDKDPGRVFREPDLLPKGTRPGIVAGIPAGKVALRIEAAKVTGIVGLRRGDRFDLMATWREEKPTSGGPLMWPYTSGGGVGGGGGTQSQRAEVVRVAANAAVVEPLSARRTQDGAGGQGAVVEEMVIAVASSEVPLVTEALEFAVRIDCVPLSGRPVSAPPSEGASRSASRVARDTRGRPQKTVVETIQGNQRFLLEVPVASPDPEALPGTRTGLRF